ncbi:MAG: DUF2791 family P-loop domain-containing protein [Thermaerobacter sp.]|nr:DUF2791 family P-loop domain-containing protein [Thermaerobacter sp.]
MERDLARRVIEHLRAGVPSLESAEVLSAGRRRLLGEIEEDLAALARGSRRGLRIIAGNYGEGKTHTLEAVEALARRDNFVVGLLTVSRETPLDRPDRIYRKLVRRTYLPGLARPGLEPILRRLGENEGAVQRLLRFCEQNLHPKLALVLEARLESTFGDVEKFERDISGYFLTSAETRRAYAAVMGRKAPKIPSFRSGDAFDYLRLLDEAAVRAGFSGLVLLFDEVEMLGRLGRLGRARSYDFLQRLSDPRIFPHTYPVLAVASSFQADLEGRLGEMEHLPAWLEAHGRPEFKEAVRSVVRRLEEAPHLAPLSEEDLAEVFGGIAQAHAAAFSWQPPVDGKELLAAVRVPLRERDLKVRQLVRAAVHYLDLYRAYGEAPQLQVQAMGEAAPVYGGDEGMEEGEAVRRNWPD